MPLIEEDVKRNVVDQLAWDDRVNASKIGVTVDGGTVVLSGSVATPFARQAATQDARVVLGVVAVDNQLVVDMVDAIPPTRSVNDELIATDIRAVINRRIDIDIEDVDIEVEDGVVTLTGTVPTWTARSAAMEAASYTLGVTAVIDNLIVTAP